MAVLAKTYTCGLDGVNGFPVEVEAYISGGMVGFEIATKLFEGDKPLEEELGLSEETRHIIEEILSSMEKAVGMERAAVMADTRYRFIEKLLSTCFRRGQTEENTLTDRIDNVLTHPLLSIPVFLLMMFLVFFLTFGPVGSFFADGFAGRRRVQCFWRLLFRIYLPDGHLRRRACNSYRLWNFVFCDADAFFQPQKYASADESGTAAAQASEDLCDRFFYLFYRRVHGHPDGAF